MQPHIAERRLSMSTRAVALGVAVLLWSAAVCQAAGGEIIVSGQQADAVTVKDMPADNGVVAGVVVNNSRQVVRDVKLLIRNAWLWNNERHPGAVNPGNAEFFTVRGEIPPGASLPFTYRTPPLPQRSDGHFITSAEVVEFTQVGSSAASF
jgi:hypothetical protein